MLKVANIIKREKVKPTHAKLDSVDHIGANNVQLQPTTVITPTVITPTIITPAVITRTICIINDDINKSIVILPSIIRCTTCGGSGFVKTDAITCDSCKGNKCMNCNSLGLTRLPWSECPICYGSGEIRRSM
jgi:hypothetical protein